MLRRFSLLLIVLLSPGFVFADPSNLEGGVFVAHHPPGLLYSSGQDWCARYFQEFAIDSCSEQNNHIDLDGHNGEESVWFVLAAWVEQKEWCGAEFGFAEYGSTIYLFDQWGPCFPSDGLEIPTAGWPGPNGGTALTTQDEPWAGNFVPIYWFSGYAYEGGEIPLAANPASEFGGTANCETPPAVFATTAFGSMGLFREGIYVCPEDGIDGGGSEPEGGGDTAEEEDGGGGEDGRTTWHVCPDGSGNYRTIQEAVDAAAAGDIIELCDATFSGPLNRNIHFDGKVLTVRSWSANPTACVIDCMGRNVIPSVPEARRGFVFERWDTVTVSGVTIFDGLAYEPPPGA